jgi:nucleoside-diphosphate-sugar epimerase
MNIFLTGASGFIGSHLLPKLLQANHKVYALSHSSKTLDSFQQPNLVKICGSLNSDFTDYLKKN